MVVARQAERLRSVTGITILVRGVIFFFKQNSNTGKSPSVDAALLTYSAS